MTKTALLLLTFLGLYFSHVEPPSFTPIEREFPLHWKTHMGKAAFRTNVVLENDRLMIGSNGDHLKDNHVFDRNAGVYTIDRRTGRRIRKIGGEPFGDMDVCGVKLLEGRLYYGNDNEEFICSMPDGRILWRKPTSGDIEHEPVVVKREGRNTLVYATESGEVCSVDPETGKSIWTYYTPEFKGWKPSDNRMVFKVYGLFSREWEFLLKPEKADLNLDGTEDLVYCNFGTVTAIDGRSGRQLWRKTSQGSRDYFTSLASVEYEGKFPKLNVINHFTDSSRGDSYSKPSYYSIVQFDAKGERLSEKTILKDRKSHYWAEMALNRLKTPNGETCFTLDGHIIVLGRNLETRTIDASIPFEWTDATYGKRAGNHNSRESLLGSRVFTYKDRENCVLVMSQADEKDYRLPGFVSIVSLDSGEILGTWSLPAEAEMPPLIEDIDRDGRLDLLVNTHDGNLNCYDFKNAKQP